MLSRGAWGRFRSRLRGRWKTSGFPGQAGCQQITAPDQKAGAFWRVNSVVRFERGAEVQVNSKKENMDETGEAKEHIQRIFGVGSEFERNVFVMMRYGTDTCGAIEQAIRSSLVANGLTPHLAKDRSLVDSLWENVETYIDNCKYGLAVFEDTDIREYNPNVSIELGYMLGQGKRCLLLKEQRMPRLPTDIVGHIYRSFDIFNIADSIPREIEAWVRDDLGLSQSDEVSQIFEDDSTEGRKLQDILLFLYKEDRPVSPHEIEQYMYPHIGDFTTDVNRVIEQLRSLRLVAFNENPDTFGFYHLPEKVPRRVSLLVRGGKEAT